MFFDGVSCNESKPGEHSKAIRCARMVVTAAIQLTHSLFESARDDVLDPWLEDRFAGSSHAPEKLQCQLQRG